MVVDCPSGLFGLLVGLRLTVKRRSSRRGNEWTRLKARGGGREKKMYGERVEDRGKSMKWGNGDRQLAGDIVGGDGEAYNTRKGWDPIAHFCICCCDDLRALDE
jgi:hypothetical protein